MTTETERRLSLPLTKEDAASLRAGECVLLTGPMLVARDAAHQKMDALLDAQKPLPAELDGETIYYMGPSPAREGRPIGSAGPTTASRMDVYTPRLLDLGLRGMVGKGRRSSEVKEAIKRNGAVYMAAAGGAGAMLSKCITESCVIAWPELGAEALLRIVVRDFPAVVVCDSAGGDLYEQISTPIP